jgi:sialate O-acetylesterase
MEKYMNRLNKTPAFLLALLLLAAGKTDCTAALWLPHSLSDHILFQQQEPIVIWGNATPGAEIAVELADEKTGAVVGKGRAKTAADGKWKIQLDPLKASFKKYAVTITGDKESRVIHDVLVGELWLTGGQSNMSFPVAAIIRGNELMKSASYDTIRIFSQSYLDDAWTRSGSEKPLDDTSNGQWLQANSAVNVANCSGVAYTFALALYDALNQRGREVPVGVMNTAVGATEIASWISRPAADAVPELRSKLTLTLNDFPNYPTNQAFHQAAGLFNCKIAPLATHAVRGFLWYQGESDALSMGAGATVAEYYRKALPVLIEDWRKLWGDRPRPFIFSQLASFQDKYSSNNVDHVYWAYLREAQLETVHAVPQTAAIPIHDVDAIWHLPGTKEEEAPDFNPIHPLDKQPVGGRMALAARALAYHEAVEYQGPVFKRMEVKGDEAILHFLHADGLKVKGDCLNGFAICGSDRHFVAGQAKVVGQTVEVRSPEVKQPVAVTYAFTDLNHGANLFNGHDLPAFAFRTDKVISAYLNGAAKP